MQHLGPGPGIAAVGGETEGRKNSWASGEGLEGQNRELALGCNLLVVTLQESFFQKCQEGSQWTGIRDRTGGRQKQSPNLWNNVSSSDPWSLGFPREEFRHLKILGVEMGAVLAPKGLS